jgi:hypothetical protein
VWKFSYTPLLGLRIRYDNVTLSSHSDQCISISHMFKSLVNLKIRFKIVNNPSLFDVNIERRVRFLLLLLPGMIKNMWGVRRVRFTLYNSLTCNINTQVRARWNSLISIIISVHIFYVCPSSKRDILNYPEFSFAFYRMLTYFSNCPEELCTFVYLCLRVEK